MPSNVFSLLLKQTFTPIIWIFTECEGDGIESRLPFKIFSTLFHTEPPLPMPPKRRITTEMSFAKPLNSPQWVESNSEWESLLFWHNYSFARYFVNSITIIQCYNLGTVKVKVEIILKGSLDSIPSSAPSVKIQIAGGKVLPQSFRRCKKKDC